jgi:hypothetical protein
MYSRRLATSGIALESPIRLYQNCIKPLLFDPLRLSAERKQTPHVVEIPRNWIGLKEALEAVHAPPEQKA